MALWYVEVVPVVSARIARHGEVTFQLAVVDLNSYGLKSLW